MKASFVICALGVLLPLAPLSAQAQDLALPDPIVQTETVMAANAGDDGQAGLSLSADSGSSIDQAGDDASSGTLRTRKPIKRRR